MVANDPYRINLVGRGLEHKFYYPTRSEAIDMARSMSEASYMGVEFTVYHEATNIKVAFFAGVR